MKSRSVPTLAAVLALLSLIPTPVTATSRSKGCDLEHDVDLASQSLDFSVNNRLNRVSLPKSYKDGQAAPLIIAYHDADQRAEEFEKETALIGHVNNTHHIVVYPRAAEGKWQVVADKEDNDLTFTADLLEEVLDVLCIDTNRIYATGLGAGAGLANQIACHPELSRRFAAYAMVNGAYGSPTGADNITTLECAPAEPATRILSIHGQINTVHRYFPAKVPEEVEEGTLATPKSGSTAPSIVQWLVEWALRNNCGASFGHPTPLSMEKTPEDASLTRLQRGSLTEAFSHNEGVIVASYKCWAQSENEMRGLVEKLIRKYDTEIEPFGDIGNSPQDMERFILQRTDEIVAGSTAALKKLVKTREEVARKGGEEQREHVQRTVAFADKGVEVLRHLAVQDAGHGWLRLEASISEDGTEGLWTPLESKSESSSDPTTTFDSTAEILQWFTMHRLSDTVPTSEIEEANAEEFLSALSDEQGITDFLAEMSAMITMKDQMTKRMLGDMKKEADPESEIGKQRAKERQEIREKFEKLQAEEKKKKKGSRDRDEL